MFEILANSVIASGGPFPCRKLVKKSRGRPAKSSKSNAQVATKVSFLWTKSPILIQWMVRKTSKTSYLYLAQRTLNRWIHGLSITHMWRVVFSLLSPNRIAVYTYGNLINLKKYYKVVYDEFVFERFGFRDIKTSKKDELKNSKPCNIEQFVLQIPIPFEMVFDQLKSQFEAFVPKDTWSARVKVEVDLAFTLKL